MTRDHAFSDCIPKPLFHPRIFRLFFPTRLPLQSYCCLRAISASDFHVAALLCPFIRFNFSFSRRSAFLRGSAAPPPLSMKSETSIAPLFFLPRSLCSSILPPIRAIYSDISNYVDPDPVHSNYIGIPLRQLTNAGVFVRKTDRTKFPSIKGSISLH